MANRQTRRREMKTVKTEEIETSKVSVVGIIFVALSVLCILGLFYLLTIYITNKHSNKNNTTETETTEESINYDKISIGKTFSVSSDDYLVVFYDTSNSDISNTYSNLISTYKAKEEHLPIYYVDMNDSFNKKYTSSEGNRNATNASELSINGPTLIKVSNNALVDYLEGEESISEYLK